MALIDVCNTVFVLSAEYGEEEEDNNIMAPTPKQRKLCSQLGLKKNVTGSTSKVPQDCLASGHYLSAMILLLTIVYSIYNCKQSKIKLVEPAWSLLQFGTRSKHMHHSLGIGNAQDY